MDTQLAPRPGRHDHPPQPVPHPDPRPEPARAPVRRVGPLDRAAMHLGLALVAWGRRPVRKARRERPVFSPESVRARRELDNVRDQYLVLKLTQFR